MIVFDLSCDGGHQFEGWFGSSADYARQAERGLVSCPQCGSVAVTKAPMAPAVPRKGNQDSPRRRSEDAAARGQPPHRAPTEGQAVTRGPLPPEVSAALEKLAEAQAKALASSRWVGGDFAEQSRAMHYGERDAAPIHGQASMEEAEELLEEGIAITPLPFPVAPPEDLN